MEVLTVLLLEEVAADKLIESPEGSTAGKLLPMMTFDLVLCLFLYRSTEV
jgi:hypothetical protein